jgi:hypothetical protein
MEEVCCKLARTAPVTQIVLYRIKILMARSLGFSPTRRSPRPFLIAQPKPAAWGWASCSPTGIKMPFPKVSSTGVKVGFWRALHHFYVELVHLLGLLD